MSNPERTAHSRPAPPTLDRLMVVTLGATALQAYDPATGGMALRLPPAQLLQQALAALSAAGHAVRAELTALPQRSGAELTMTTLCAVRDLVLQRLKDGGCSAVVLLCGTDTLEDAAFSLHLMLADALRDRRTLLCITGAMLPADQLGGDGARNLRDALRVASDPGVRGAAAGQVLVVLNDNIHLAQYVFKADSQLPGAFRSHPGPLGQLRGGTPVLYYAPPPPQATQSSAAASAPAEAQHAQQHPGAHPPWLPRPEFRRLPAAALARHVAIWPLTVDGQPPPEALLSLLDGLVLAGSGTGSLPASVVDALAGPSASAGGVSSSSGREASEGDGTGGSCSEGSCRPWTSRLPIVISSRCHWGSNHDDFCYKGSLAKYEGRGFVLRGGYEQLNPLQARTLLALRLAAFGRA
ncbi:hypothetical protein ABPG77_007594 [Micractinium sp. CCAP 211/92]